MILVVGALIKRDDTILLARRSKGELKGFWEFPGGKVEKDETVDDAITREIYEELKIQIKPVKKVKTFTHKYSFAEIKLVLIECETDTNVYVDLTGSHTEFVWVTLSDATQMLLAPLDKKILNHLLSKKSNN